MNPDNWPEFFRAAQKKADEESAERVRRRIERIMRQIAEEGALLEPAVKLARCPCCSGSGTLRLTTNALDDHDAP